MGREQTALSWLRRYDALLREREEESRREQVVREILKAKAAEDVLPPSFHLARPEDPLNRRKRPLRDTLVPIFLPRAEAPMQTAVAATGLEPEVEPEGRMFERAERAERASGVVPRLPRLEPEAAFAEPLADESIDVVLEESVRPAPVAEAPRVEAIAALDALDTLARQVVPSPADDFASQDGHLGHLATQDVVPPADVLAPELEPFDREQEVLAPEDVSAEPPDAVAEALAFVGRAEEDDEPAPLPELAMAAVGAWSSIPPPPVDDATTDAMAMPPAFTLPPPRITVLGPPPMDETTEPIEMGFPKEAPLPIDLSPLGLSPLGVSPRGASQVAPVAQAEASGPLLLSPPPAPKLAPLELSPPPLEPYRQMPNVSGRPVELTPPSLPLAANATPAATADANATTSAVPNANAASVAPVIPASIATANAAPIPLPVFDLKNPWARDDDAKPAPKPAPPLSERLAPWKPALRTLSLALVAATVGITVRGGLALREAAKTPAPVPPTPVTAPAAAPAPAPVAPNEPTALGAKVQGTLEITAAPDVPIVVDGIERGRGPKLSLPLGTGYHMVRVGNGAAQLVQIRTKQTTGLDLSGTR